MTIIPITWDCELVYQPHWGPAKTLVPWTTLATCPHCEAMTMFLPVGLVTCACCGEVTPVDQWYPTCH
jgi:hypothetical protein